MSSELVYTTSTDHRRPARTNALAANPNATIRFERENDSGTGWVFIGPYKMAVSHLDDEPLEDRIASFTLLGKRWSEYQVWLFEDRIEISYSFYDTSQGDPPRSAFDVRGWEGNAASFFRYVRDELYPDYLEAQSNPTALEATI